MNHKTKINYFSHAGIICFFLCSTLFIGCSAPEKRLKKERLTLVYRQQSSFDTEIKKLRLEHPIKISVEQTANHLLSLHYEELGSAIGPILIRKWLGESPKILKGSILAAFFLGSLALLAFSVSKNLWLTSLCIGLSGMFGSIVWVFSTALIHLEADRQFLGRIFGIEMALLTLIMGISNGVVGVAIDGLQMTIQSVILWMSGLYMIPGILWIIFLASGTKLKKS